MAELTYMANISSLASDVKRELSFVAMRMRDDKGNSLYDGLVPHTKDMPLIEAGIGDSIRGIVAAMGDIAVDGAAGLEFNIPDFDTRLTEDAQKEITRLIVFKGCTDWLATRLPEVAKYYVEQANSSLARLNALVRHRKPLSRV